MTLTIDYPATLPDALHMTASEFERTARFAMASRLYQEGRISSGQAAQFAGLNRVDFLLELPRHGMSMSNLSDEDFLGDVHHA